MVNDPIKIMSHFRRGHQATKSVPGIPSRARGARDGQSSTPRQRCAAPPEIERGDTPSSKRIPCRQFLGLMPSKGPDSAVAKQTATVARILGEDSIDALGQGGRVS